MKHKEGNLPKCSECFYYHEKEGNDCLYDGWCTNPYQLSHGINGKLRETPKKRETVRWMWCCRQWEDAEDRFDYYECVTGKYRGRPERIKMEGMK